MANPNITSIVSVQQGTGIAPQPKESVVQISVNFTADNPCNFAVQWSPNNGVTWYDATMHNTGNGQNVTPGSGVLLFLDVEKSRSANSVTAATWAQFKVRLTATDRVTLGSSAQVTQSTTSTVKGTRPIALSFNMALWISQALATAAPFAFVGKDFDAGNVLQDLITLDPLHKMRLSVNLADLDAGTSLVFSSFNENGTFNFGGSPEGPYTVYIKIYDQFYNASDAASWSTFLQRTAPSNCTIKIGGSSGSNDYTGIRINADGSFTPDRGVKVELSAKSTSSIPLSFQILTSSDIELSNNVGVDFALTAVNAVQLLNVTTNRSSPSSDNFNKDQNVNVAVLFKDAAGNTTTVSKSIRLNTRIYKTANKPLRKAEADYRQTLKFVNSGGQEVLVPQTMVISSAPTRSWADIYYPSTHGYPIDVNGNIDLPTVLANSNLVGGLATTQYDPVLLAPSGVTFTLVVDEDNRPLTGLWTKDGTKNYNNMESADVLSPRYWVLDNTGQPDYQLEFEFFDLDSNFYGPPFNRQAPYRGDVLVVYDATATGALVLDSTGVTPKYVLGDTTKLKQIAAYTGQGVNIVNLVTGQTVGANANGGFIGPVIVNTPKIVLFLYSDFSGTASGFRLKSAKGRDNVYTNYNVDYSHGEIWVHLHSSLSQSSVIGSADTTEKRLYYDYLSNVPTVNYQTGDVVFDTAPLPTGSLGPWVEVDWSYYDYSDGTLPGVNIFIASTDDFVDYNDAPVYVMPPDVPGYLARGSTGVISTPNNASNTITGDIDLRCKAALTSWNTGATQSLISRYPSAGGLAYLLSVNTTGGLSFSWSPDGSASNVINSTVAMTLSAGQTKWVRATWQASNRVATFYTSDDGVTWTQLGAASGAGGVATLFASTGVIEIGSDTNGTHQAQGKIYRAEIRSGINGSLVAATNFEGIGQGAISAFHGDQGNLWSITGSLVIIPTQTTLTPDSNLKSLLYETVQQGRMINSAIWDKDRGTVEVSPSGVTPSGHRMTADYYAHSFTRLSNDGFGDLAFRDKIIVPDVISQYPDFTWADVKIVNEGNAELKDMLIKFVPRGYDTNSDGNVILTGDGVVDQVLDINRPWDIQKGTKEETYDKMALAIRPTYDFAAKLSKSTGGSSDGLQANATAVAILSTWQNRSFGVLSSRGVVFGRAVWVLGGSGGSSYPSNISSGEKRCSLEVSGKYYSSLLI